VNAWLNGYLVLLANDSGNMSTKVSGDKIEDIGGSYTVIVGGQYRLNAGTVFIRGGSIFLN